MIWRAEFSRGRLAEVLVSEMPKANFLSESEREYVILLIDINQLLITGPNREGRGRCAMSLYEDKDHCYSLQALATTQSMALCAYFLPNVSGVCVWLSWRFCSFAHCSREPSKMSHHISDTKNTAVILAKAPVITWVLC